MTTTPQAFLSYTRMDDEGHDGAITALRAALEVQVRIVTGDRNFKIFQDVDGILFGEHWPRRLEQTLAASRFLIPVLSPGFFRSEPCRDELRKFLAHEQAAGRDDLILPIYLVDTPDLERVHLAPNDDLVQMIGERQRWDWRPHAFASPGDASLRRAVRDLAQAIAARLESEAAPVPRLQNQILVSPPEVLTRRPGEVFRDRDEPWCPEMVVIPAGLFSMGSPAGNWFFNAEKDRSDDEGPQREVTVAQPFALSRYTVTQGQFAKFVASTRHDLSGGSAIMHLTYQARSWDKAPNKELIRDRRSDRPDFHQRGYRPRPFRGTALA